VQTLKLLKEDERRACGEFAAERGREVFLMLESPPDRDFAESVRLLFRSYQEQLRASRLSAETEVFLRFHLSDIANQAPQLCALLGRRGSRAFVSLIGQESASGAKISLEAYHLDTQTPVRFRSHQGRAISVTHGAYRTMWLGLRPAAAATPGEQTAALFDELTALLASQCMAIPRSLIRTWIYLRDVDVHYRGMVDARRELFARHGLTRQTNYVASTGIEGRSASAADLVCLDALAIEGLRPEQVTYLNAPENMCPTHDYNVTFERGTRVRYGDRAHHYISGTASIDRHGQVLFPGDVLRQAERTLVNIEALLKNGGARLEHLKQLVVYLRDPSDARRVRGCLQAALPQGVPMILLRAPVCRPAWLIEIEGIAIQANDDPALAPFC